MDALEDQASRCRRHLLLCRRAIEYLNIQVTCSRNLFAICDIAVIECAEVNLLVDEIFNLERSLDSRRDSCTARRLRCADKLKMRQQQSLTERMNTHCLKLCLQRLVCLGWAPIFDSLLVELPSHPLPHHTAYWEGLLDDVQESLKIGVGIVRGPGLTTVQLHGLCLDSRCQRLRSLAPRLRGGRWFVAFGFLSSGACGLSRSACRFPLSGRDAGSPGCKEANERGRGVPRGGPGLSSGESESRSSPCWALKVAQSRVLPVAGCPIWEVGGGLC